MKHHHYPWLSQVLYLAPLACVSLTGCQGLATSSLVMLQPPVLAVAASEESVPPLGPGNAVPTPTRLAQPTDQSVILEKPPSAAPGPAEARTSAAARSLLLKATAALEAQDLVTAASVLQRYLLIYPDAALIRMQVGELSYKLNRLQDADMQFRAALGEVTDPPLPLHCKLHGHSRLMEIAAEQHDRFQEELQRGIGLLLLAEHRLTAPSKENLVTGEQLLGKARAALMRANALSPSDARPALYLISVWQLMLQPANATSAYRKATQLSPLSSLTDSEQLWLAQWGLELK